MSDLRWLLDNVPEDSIEEHALTIEDAIKENAVLKDEIRRHEKVFQFSAERIAALKRILKTCEWKHMDGICPLCSNDATDGHAPNCELDALLTTEEQE